GAESRASFGLCGSDEAIATLAFGTPSVQRAHGPNGLPRLRRCDQGNHMAHGTFDAERTGSPEISSRFIAALFLRWVMHPLDFRAVDEKFSFAIQKHTEWRQCCGGNLVGVVHHREHVRRIRLARDRRFMLAELDQWAQANLDIFGTGEELIGHLNAIL